MQSAGTSNNEEGGASVEYLPKRRDGAVRIAQQKTGGDSRIKREGANINKYRV